MELSTMIDEMVAPTFALHELIFRDAQQKSLHSEAPLMTALTGQQLRRTLAFTSRDRCGHRPRDPELAELLGAEIFAADVPLNDQEFSVALKQSELLAAQAWGAEGSFFLTDGSASGSQAVLLGSLQPGSKVIVGRDAHQAMHSALVATGAIPISVAPSFDSRIGISKGVEKEAVEQALCRYPDTAIIILESPNSYGVTCDMEAICELAHSRGIPVLVDQSRGAHFPFHPAFPQSAIVAGADAIVINTHGTLATLNQGAMLHVNGERLNLNRIESVVNALRSNHQSLPILVSLDAARRQMAQQGWGLLELTLALAGRARHGISAISGLQVLDMDQLERKRVFLDPTRLVVSTQSRRLAGFEIEGILRKDYGLAPESSDDTSIVFLITITDTRESVDALIDALSDISRRFNLANVSSASTESRPVGDEFSPSIQALSPREAHFSSVISVSLDEAIGETCAEFVVAHSGSVPILVPGEYITSAKIDFLKSLFPDDLFDDVFVDSPRGTMLVIVP